MYKIGLVYNKPRDINPEEKELDPRSYRQSEIIANHIEEALVSKGHKVTMIPASLNLLQDIEAAGDLDVIFNSCTGINNKKEQANIVGMLELLDIPIVGSSLQTHVTALHKGITKTILEKEGIPVTPFQIFKDPDEPLDGDLNFPLFVKPESEGSAVGITMDSLVNNEEELKERVKFVVDSFNQPALVEGYLSGREFSVAVIGTKNPKTLPITELKFPEDLEENIQSVDVKAENVIERVCPADISPELEKEISDIVIASFKALNCTEYVRVDVKLDENNKPHIIELNSLPALEPGYAHFPVMAEAGGYTMADLVETLVKEALSA